MHLEQYSKKAADNIKENANITIPWDQLLEIILGLFDDCFASEENFVESAKNPTFLQKAVLNVRLRKEFGLKGRKPAEISENLFAAYADSDDNKLKAAYHEAMAALNPIDYDMGVDNLKMHDHSADNADVSTALVPPSVPKPN
jgi:hypothetical protein